MNIKRIVSDEMDQNCYLLENEGKGILIDPGLDTGKIIRETEGVLITHILLTHCHFDHTYSLTALRDSKTVIGSKKCSNNIILREISLLPKEAAVESPCDIIMEDGEEKDICGIKIKCIHTPGHTNGSVCYFVENCLFSGDTLFFESIGRWDLPTGNYAELENSIKNKLYKLDAKTRVYPGHGKVTGIGFERVYNRYITE